MKLFKHVSLALFSIIFLFQSCTIEKRVHRSGYHVEWHKSKQSASKEITKSASEAEQDFIVVEDFQPRSSDELVESNDEFDTDFPLADVSIQDINETQEVVLSEDEECDVIILKNGDEISAKVLEVGTYEVKYLKCDNLTGPSFTLRKSDVFMIKHPNGTKTLIYDPAEASDADGDEITEEDYVKTISSDDKSFYVAVGLWFFLGIIGIHRFYLGHYGMGILYLLTAGLCGIGWLIDGILFVTGSLQPAEGEYIDD